VLVKALTEEVFLCKTAEVGALHAGLFWYQNPRAAVGWSSRKSLVGSGRRLHPDDLGFGTSLRGQHL